MTLGLDVLGKMLPGFALYDEFYVSVADAKHF